MVARRHVRMTLREAREARHLTQSDVAEAMDWSLSKVIRIESGEVSISTNDLRLVLSYLGITDKKLIESLVEAAKSSRTRQQPWWQQSPFREHLTPASRRLVEFELQARTTRTYHNITLPGRLQIPSYAEASLTNWRGELDESVIDARLKARLRRREAFLAAKGYQVHLLIDESVLYRTTGDPRILADQLAELLRLIDLKRITLRIIPFRFEGPQPSFGMFEILYLGEDGDETNAVIYIEDYLSDHVIDDHTKVSGHREKFDQLWDLATAEPASQKIISQRIHELTDR
jgi:transcriptional regulator with XRE-family HTH domain